MRQNRGGAGEAGWVGDCFYVVRGGGVVGEGENAVYK